MAPHAESPRDEGATFYLNPNGTVNGASKEVIDGHTNGIFDTPSTTAEKPNILFIMADQMAAPLLKMHDQNSVIKTPNIDKLADTGVVFDSAYCNSPLCAPSRFCLVSGQLPSKIGAYDNASHFNADIPTFAHYQRLAGYETSLIGKMHFVGPDQLHGYENRPMPDIYPADLGWTVNWDNPEDRQEWFHNMDSVLQAGVAVATNQMDFDDEVLHRSKQFLKDHVRKGETRPFSLTVSFTHPHDPYAIPQDLWDEYDGVEIPLPKVNIPQDEQDPHSKRIQKCIDLWDHPVPQEALIRARRAYFGACTYVDRQIGELIKTLKQCNLDKNTIIVFSGDHGDMLGERNMWYKMSWFEQSGRVPMVINYPARFAPRRVKESISTIDLMPTLVELAGSKLDPYLEVDGRSLVPALEGKPIHDEAIGEYMGEGSISPVIMIRRSKWKYISCLVDPPQLFDLSTDPLELRNLCDPTTNPDAKARAAAESFATEISTNWNLRKTHNQVVNSQRRRRLIHNAMMQGKFTPWDHIPNVDWANMYIRSQIPLDTLELKARYPVVDRLGNATLKKSTV